MNKRTEIEYLKEFMIGPHSSVWIETKRMSLYVRKGYHLDHLGKNIISTFDLANIETRPQGHGIFTEVLGQIEREFPTWNLYIENVMSERFATFFDKRDYIRIPQPRDNMGLPSFIKYGIK